MYSNFPNNYDYNQMNPNFQNSQNYNQITTNLNNNYYFPNNTGNNNNFNNVIYNNIMYNDNINQNKALNNNEIINNNFMNNNTMINKNNSFENNNIKINSSFSNYNNKNNNLFNNNKNKTINNYKSNMKKPLHKKNNFNNANEFGPIENANNFTPFNITQINNNNSDNNNLAQNNLNPFNINLNNNLPPFSQNTNNINNQFSSFPNNNNFNNTFEFQNQLNNAFNINNTNKIKNNNLNAHNDSIFLNRNNAKKQLDLGKLYICPQCNQTLDENLKKDHQLSHEIHEKERKGKIYFALKRNNNMQEHLRNPGDNRNVLHLIIGNIRDRNNPWSPINNRNNNHHHRNFIGINPRTHSAYIIIDRNNIRHNHLDFPEIVIQDLNKLEEGNKKCMICLEDFHKNEKVTSLPCIHFFHPKCIKQWMEKKLECPVCKLVLTQTNIYRKIKHL